MKPSEQKQLAEKAAKWLGCEERNNPINNDFFIIPGFEDKAVKDYGLPSVFFDDPKPASYLMHLGKREMERREYFIQYQTDHAPDLQISHRWTFVPLDQIKWEDGGEYQDESTFYAFWKAVEQTGVMEK